MPYTFIDLFAGCGGLSEGFLRSNHYQALAHIEWELPMVNTLRDRLVQAWHHTEDEARKRVIQFDIQKTNELLNGNWGEVSVTQYGANNHPDIIARGLNGVIDNTHVNLIIGGPPCQAYSIHGRATDANNMENDYRNFLFESFCRVVDSYRPDVFVFENVAGLLSAHPGGIPVTERIFNAFHEIGYQIKAPEDLHEALFNAVNFNVPQNRPRVIILGIPEDSTLNLDELYDSIINEQNFDHLLTVEDAIGDLPPLYPLGEEIHINRGKRSHIPNNDPNVTQHEARYHNERDRGIYYHWVHDNMNHIPHQEMVHFYQEMTGHNTLFQKYKSLQWNMPSHTVVAHLSKDGHMFIHPDELQQRSIRIREAACLQTFPRDFQFLGSNPYNYKMIGNAVPVNFAEAIANAINNVLVAHPEIPEI